MAMKKEKGFTLIEILMVVFLLGIIVVIGSNLFFSILKGASKAEITKEVKQNGDYALAVMERHLRNASSVESCGQVENVWYGCRCQRFIHGHCSWWGWWWRWPWWGWFDNLEDCESECASRAYPCEWSCEKFDFPSGSFSIVYTDQEGETGFFNCMEGEYIASGSARLTSENVVARNCSFSCDPTKTPPVVNISFDLSQKGTGLRPEEKAQVHFQTTVSLRSY